MRILYKAFLFAFLIPQLALADRTFQYRGYMATQQILEGRVFQPGTTRVFADYYDGKYDQYTYGDLVDLLGSYKGTEGNLDGEIKNATPNPINTLLYLVGFRGVAQDIGSLCDPKSPFAQFANPDLLHATQPLCNFPVSDAVLTQALQNIWSILMSYDAPPEVFTEWSAYIFSQKPNYKSSQDLIQSMTFTLLMDPYFLLSQ